MDFQLSRFHFFRGDDVAAARFDDDDDDDDWTAEMGLGVLNFDFCGEEDRKGVLEIS